MTTEKTGVDFVLYATENVRRAIKAVDLFFELAKTVSREAGRDHLILAMSGIHIHFSEFAKVLTLKIPEEEERVYQTHSGLCPAVALYNLAYKGHGNPEERELISWIFYLDQYIDSTKNREDILKKAEDIGVPAEVLDYDHLLTCAKIAVGNILNRTV